MFVFWGPELIKIYNDGYRPITGHKHPWALGRPAREVWPEIWSDIEPLVARALAGDPTYSDDLMLFMERSGFREEVYFTFSYSPVPDESGGVGGMFCACTETTARVIGERRLRTLRDLAVSPADARTIDAHLRAGGRRAGGEHGRRPVRAASTCGSRTAARASSRRPVSRAGDRRGAARRRRGRRGLADRDGRPRRGVAEFVTGLSERIGVVPAGAWPEPPPAAMVLPLADRGLGRNVGADRAAASAPAARSTPSTGAGSSCSPSQIGGLIGNARAAEDERQRAEALAELDRAKTTFFSNVSHEFRTPLTLMLGPLEEALSATGAAGGRPRSSSSVAHRNGLRLLKLVNTLLDFSRIEAGRAAGAATSRSTSARSPPSSPATFRSAIERAGLDVHRRLPAARPSRSYVDREMWEKIVLNLLSNAFKFTLDGGIAVAPAARRRRRRC